MTPNGAVGRHHPSLRWKWFLAWVGLGAGYSLALLGALSIGLIVLPFAVGGTVLVATRDRAGEGVPGLLSGLGFPLLYVAYLNRDGPATVCTGLRDGGQHCIDEVSPWPWVAIGVALLLAGVAVFSTRHRNRNRMPSDRVRRSFAALLDNITFSARVVFTGFEQASAQTWPVDFTAREPAAPRMRTPPGWPSVSGSASGMGRCRAVEPLPFGDRRSDLRSATFCQTSGTDHARAGASTRAHRGPPRLSVMSIAAPRRPVAIALSINSGSTRSSISSARLNISNVFVRSYVSPREIDESIATLAVNARSAEV